MKKIFRRARILALEVCYQLDIQNLMCLKNADQVFEDMQVNDSSVLSRAKKIVTGVITNLSLIDELIKKHSKNWDISRMVYIDRNILRIAVYEMLFMPDVPDIVAINEAIEISKIYSSSESGKFINGLLDSIRKEIVSQQK
ncbi:MAG: transcription antitermination factor NusB [Candidatus Omnitrophica bacterium]|nr:transcription antitermination factor NusB [Candidatus Omnitrophota bacterium]